LLASNSDHITHIDFLKEIDSEIIVFQEYTHLWDAALTNALTEYPHRLTAPIDSPFGIAIYSKFPFKQKAITYFSNRQKPAARVTISHTGRDIAILGAHPPPPISTELYDERNLQLQKIAELTKTRATTTIVIGDLNTSPWSAHFQNLLTEGQLLDARAGHGILATWPTWFAPLQIPIDHILVSTDLDVISVNTSSGLNSDHKSIWATITFYTENIDNPG